MNRLSNDEFLKRIQERHLCIVPIEEYVTSDTPIKFQCNRCGLIFEKKPIILLQKGAGCGCPKCVSQDKHDKMSYTKEEYEKMLEAKTTSLKLIGNYINGKTKTKFRCLSCKHEWLSQPSVMLFKPSCPKCAKEAVVKRRTKTHEQFCSELQQTFPNIIPLEKYVNNNTKIKFRCTVCNYEWLKIPATLVSKARPKGCPVCGGCMLKTQEQFEEQIKRKNPYVAITGKYINDATKIEYRCNICGLLHKATPSVLLQGRGCPICNASKGEKRIKEFLDANGYSYRVQKEFPDLLGVGYGHLSYDFYLQDNNVLIEYQGKQHYEPINFFKRTDIDEVEMFEIQKIHDKRKKDYAEENGFRLIIIPYWDYNNINLILQEELCNA